MLLLRTVTFCKVPNLCAANAASKLAAMIRYYRTAPGPQVTRGAVN